MSERASRSVAISLAALLVALVAAALAVDLWSHWSGTAGDVGFEGTIALVFGGVGLLIALRRRENALGWILLGLGVAWGVALFTNEYAVVALKLRPGSLRGGLAAADVSNVSWIPGVGLTASLLLLLFPTGRPLSPRWRAAVWSSAIGVSLAVAMTLLAPGRLDDPFQDFRNPIGVEAGAARAIVVALQTVGFLLMLGSILAAVVSMVLRFRRSVGEERRQLKMFTWTTAVAGIVLVSTFFVYASAPGFFSVVVGIAIASIPVAAGIAILRYRMYDIEIVVNKAVVYGVLAAFITAVYFAIVVGLGSLRAGWPLNGGPLSAAATALVAIAFQPVRRRAQRLANRLVYGRRATPYEVLSGFSDRLAAVNSPEDLLRQTVRIVAEGTGAVRTEVWLKVGGELRRAAAWPADAPDPGPVASPGDDIPSFDGADRPIAVRHQGEVLGALTVFKPKGDPVTPTEEALLADVASQAGLVLRNAALTADLRARLEELRASRQRLVAAQDEERRRLERNLHDGAQQQLVALSIKLGLARKMANGDERVAGLLEQLQAEAGDALENLRDLARGIYPPLLADQGLPAALAAQARKAAVPTTVDADGVGRYPQEVEAAVYFSVLEALQNVAKYAQATSAAVRLRQEDGALSFEVSDDGRGFDTSKTTYGTGLQGIADRLAAQSGTLDIRSEPGRGTTVTGRLPVTEGSVVRP